MILTNTLQNLHAVVPRQIEVEQDEIRHRWGTAFREKKRQGFFPVASEFKRTRDVILSQCIADQIDVSRVVFGEKDLNQ